jgi:hypothetical protein
MELRREASFLGAPEQALIQTIGACLVKGHAMPSGEAVVGGAHHVEVEMKGGLGWDLGDDVEGIDDNNEVIVFGILDIMEVPRDAMQLGKMVSLCIELALRLPTDYDWRWVAVQQC